jgi:hypothetical protein
MRRSGQIRHELELLETIRGEGLAADSRSPPSLVAYLSGQFESPAPACSSAPGAKASMAAYGNPAVKQPGSPRSEVGIIFVNPGNGRLATLKNLPTQPSSQPSSRPCRWRRRRPYLWRVQLVQKHCLLIFVEQLQVLISLPLELLG